MRVRILGTAAGGGAPQWNCACNPCARLRGLGPSAWRTQDSIAVTDGHSGWFLINASPDLRTQILRTDELAPGPAPRQTPIRGVLLTDAELDHTMGLVALREATALDVYATAPVLDALDTGFPLRRLLQPYEGAWTWTATATGTPLRLGSHLSVTTIALGTKRPRYAAAPPDDAPWVVGYRVEDLRTGGALVYAPCLAAWTRALDDACVGADYLIVDGTFYYDDEMTRATGRGASALGMGHMPIAGPGGSLEHAREHGGMRVLYTHLNNTNPLVCAASPEHAVIEATGAAVASERMILTC